MCHYRDLITTVSNTFGIATISTFGYENDAFGRRTARTDTTPTLTVNNAFGYNLKSEVTSATMGENQYGYDYDPIGNRIYAAFNTATNTYSANPLNQYSSLQPITLSYDLDGNMLTNGVWSYTWDAENRLTAVYSNNTLLVSNVYDHQSRRIAKTTTEGTRTFIWDGWNLISETLPTSNFSLPTFYTWGLDLSGTLQSAGGVGGLLAVHNDNSVYFPCFDANGNVTEYVDASGTIRAHYAFDAFGNTITQSGDLASTFSYRFSTKYADDETGLYYYGYRFYSLELGRWVNRDLIEEEGGLNLIAVNWNNNINFVDCLGLWGILEGDASKWPTGKEDLMYGEYIALKGMTKIVFSVEWKYQGFACCKDPKEIKICKEESYGPHYFNNDADDNYYNVWNLETAGEVIEGQKIRGIPLGPGGFGKDKNGIGCVEGGDKGKMVITLSWSRDTSGVPSKGLKRTQLDYGTHGATWNIHDHFPWTDKPFHPFTAGKPMPIEKGKSGVVTTTIEWDYCFGKEDFKFSTLDSETGKPLPVGGNRGQAGTKIY